jgi:hypothetical protein
VIPAAVFVEEERLYLSRQDFTVDCRAVTVNKAHILRRRPRFDDWEVTFTVCFDEGAISAETLISILEEAGRTKGIGDYRPKFGRFSVVENAEAA